MNSFIKKARALSLTCLIVILIEITIGIICYKLHVLKYVLMAVAIGDIWLISYFGYMDYREKKQLNTNCAKKQA